MDVLVSVVAATIKPIGHQLGYLVCYNKNKKELQEQIENLETTKRDVDKRVEEAKGKAYTVSDEVSKWLTDVDGAMIHHQLSSSNPSCFNLAQRYRLSRETKKKVNYILQLIDKRNKFLEVGYRAPLADTENTIVPGDYQVLESKTSLAKDIKNALAKPDVNKVGVYGMGGVGKTYLLNEVKRLVLKEDDKSFDRVIDVSVGRSNDLTQIQEQIGDQLNIELPKSKEGRASFLRNNLAKMEGNILVLLDDLWKEYDLIKEIGIPLSKEGCKVLMTSRSRDILTNNMNTQECFQVSSLTEEESWKFFKAIIGDKFDTIYMESIAKEVSKECGGLPLALDTIAKALKGKDMHYWEDALSKLKNSIGMDIKGVSDKVYASLRLSYEYLDGEETKLLFLLCSVFPDDYKIGMKDLQMYAMGMRLLNKVKTWEDAKNRVMKLVHDLISSSLFLEADSDSKDKYVKMHDVVRDVAIHIASNEGNMSTLNIGYKLNEWEDEYRSGSHRAIFANCDNLNNLPPKMKFPQLELLILRVSNWLVENNLQIPYAFFEGMEKLKVLDMTGMCFHRPLWTTSSLNNLRTLCMVCCEFNDIDTIGELKKLEILRIMKCNMLDHLPTTMSQLTHLKVLEVLNCSKLEVVPANIFSSMTKLEELKLQDSFCRWGEEVWYKDELIKNVKLSELNYLPRLSNLCLESWKVKILSEISSQTCKNLKEFWICSNESDDIIQPKVSNEYATTLMLNIESQIGSIDGGLEILLQRSERLIVSDSMGNFVNGIFKPNGNGFPLLKYLWIIDEHSNSEMPHLIGSDFTSLKYLILYGMRRLENIVPKHITISPFKKLKTIAIQFCGQLRNLFSFSIFKGLSDLQEIEVINCGMMDEIIFMEIEDQPNICTTPLASLILENVDKLSSFCTKGLIQESPQSILPFFDQQVLFPELNDLSIIGSKNLETLWHKNNEPTTNSFCKLQSIRIEMCTKIRCMFPSNMVTSLVSLDTIEITSCASLKRIFEIEKESFGDTKVAWSLRELHLLNLPNLKHVWRKDVIEFMKFPSLKRVKIHGCTKLAHIWKENTKMTTSFDSLESIEVERCENLKYLLPSSITFLNLNELHVKECNGMMNLFSSTVAKNLVNLRSIEVSYCEGMSCIVEAKEENDESVIFKKLGKLEFDCLPRLDSFYSGKCMLEFPSLESLVIKRCPKMKTFSLGVIMTPELQSMWVEDTEFEVSSTTNSVNRTIQNFRP
ncbi:disease resistance protein At4g27190-like [Benincasa hispida]|uniref:disease resistance protein At4g27190-like n=1 Tax=Benincasa hispida TaxID=102211 RepID=UPI0019018813|nr:disease resistance protein At4g27190-like [Benincasa hispida]